MTIAFLDIHIDYPFLDIHIDYPIATVTMEDAWGVMWSLDFQEGDDGYWWFVESWVVDDTGQPRLFEAPFALIQAGFDELGAWGDVRSGESCAATPL